MVLSTANLTVEPAVGSRLPADRGRGPYEQVACSLCHPDKASCGQHCQDSHVTAPNESPSTDDYSYRRTDDHPACNSEEKIERYRSEPNRDDYRHDFLRHSFAVKQKLT